VPSRPFLVPSSASWHAHPAKPTCILAVIYFLHLHKLLIIPKSFSLKKLRMSTNNNDSGYRSDPRSISPFVINSQRSSSAMELPTSTYSRQHELNPFSSNVTTLPSRAAAYGGHTLPSPPIWSGGDRLQEYASQPRSQLGFRRQLVNDESLPSDRPSKFPSSRALPGSGQLPSIHEVTQNEPNFSGSC